MKTTDEFKRVIQAHLEERAAKDPVFKERLSAPGKNITDCVTYILNTVQKSGCNGFADEEIFGMAVHYYDEEKIEVGSRRDCSVVINHKVELSEEEKNELKTKAMKDFQDIQLRELQQSEERRIAREKKKEERLKKAEAEREAKQEEREKSMQPTLF